MKIVVLDGYALNPGDLSWEPLGALGELEVYERTSDDVREIVRRIGDAELICTNKTPIGREVIDACPRIRLIAVMATGYNLVDYAYAAEKGIPVANVPAYGTASVSQHAIALLLEVCNRVGHHDRSVHEGGWFGRIDFCYWDYPLVELDGKTMGIIGFGRIGQATGRIARALGMKVLAYDLYPSDAGRGIGEYVPLDDLLERSDVVSLHCNLTPENTGIMDRAAFEKMKDGAILINCARGQLINEQDLADALNAGKIAAAAVDVASSEPIHPDNPLLTAKNCIITPHIAWAAEESRQRIIDCTVENVRSAIEGHPTNVVNL